jgi:hypothetical protein
MRPVAEGVCDQLGLAPTWPGNPCTGSGTLPVRTDFEDKPLIGTVTTWEGIDSSGTTNGSRTGIETGCCGPVVAGGAGRSSAVPAVTVRQAATIA